MNHDVEAMFRVPGDEPRKKFPVRFWYVDIAISGNLDLLPDALDYYEAAVRDGQHYLVPKGDLQMLLTGHAGIVAFYENFLNDALKIHKWLETKLNRTKKRRYVWLLSPEGQRQFGKLRVDDMDAYVEADDEIEALIDNLNLIAAAKLDLNTLVERLHEAGIKLSLISKLREAGQTEILIDAGRASPFED